VKILTDADTPPLARNTGMVAAELIREAIVTGRLEPGQRLKEDDLARELRISRTPVREALLVLQTEGLVEATPNHVALVRSFTPAELVDMYELRALLEGYAVRRAGARITPEHLARLQESCKRFAKLRQRNDTVELVKENLFFHDTIREAAGSERLTRMVGGLVALPLVYRSYVWRSPEQFQIAEHQHNQIVAALESRDGDRAELIMKEHIFEARDMLIAQIDASADADASGQGE
jgi:DNA-binding GntR family transcriptional regulator